MVHCEMCLQGNGFRSSCTWVVSVTGRDESSQGLTCAAGVAEQCRGVPSAHVAELADAYGSGPYGETRGGSSPLVSTIFPRVNCLNNPCHKLFILSVEAERENANFLLCSECLAAGLTFGTAAYVVS